MTRQKNQINLMRNNNNLFLSSSPSATICVLQFSCDCDTVSPHSYCTSSVHVHSHTNDTEKPLQHMRSRNDTMIYCISGRPSNSMENRHKVTKKSLEMPANENKSKYFTMRRWFSFFFPRRCRWSSDSILFFQLQFSDFFLCFGIDREKKTVRDRETQKSNKCKLFCV